MHWADKIADRIIQTKGDKTTYTLAGGITPSGVVHIGNLREILTVELVKRALESKGKQARFLLFWDDFDAFRKVPEDAPNPKTLAKKLTMALSSVTVMSRVYAEQFKRPIHKALPKLGVEVEFISQTEQYKNDRYTDLILTALKAKDTLRQILNQHRKEPLPETWLPVTMYCGECHRSKISEMIYLSNTIMIYYCNHCNERYAADFSPRPNIKLLWRIDWPMRWAFWNIDFEPGGKDHSSQGSSYDTAKDIIKKVFNKEPPIYQMYDFISIKGKGGKMSSSSGNTIAVQDAADVFEPAVLRTIFATYKPNVEFSIDLGLDVIKQYNQFDALEAEYYNTPSNTPTPSKKTQRRRRIYELSNPNPPQKQPYRAPFRHLCNQLQIHNFSINKVFTLHKNQAKNDEALFRQRAKCAEAWIRRDAPEEFRFLLNQQPTTIDSLPKALAPTKATKTALAAFTQALNQLPTPWNEQAITKILHAVPKTHKIEPKTFFALVYTLLIGKPQGPKLASFLCQLPRKKSLELLRGLLTPLRRRQNNPRQELNHA